MRKTIIALILVIPLLFLFTVFYAGTAASIGVEVSVNHIQIMTKPESGVVNLDLSTYTDDMPVEVEVLPATASDKAYTFSYEAVEGNPLADVRVEEGRLIANSTGVAEVVVTSRDGGYQDRFTAVVTSSAPQDLALSLSELGGSDTLLHPTDTGYAATLSTGRYALSATLLPAGFSGVTYAFPQDETALFDEAAGTVLFPFSGETAFTASVKAKRKGQEITVTKRVELQLSRVVTQSGITVNGGAGNTVLLAVQRENEGTMSEVSVYVEAEGEPTCTYSDPRISGAEVITLGEGRYRADFTLAASSSKTEMDAELVVGENREAVHFVYDDFSFSLRSNLPVQGQSVDHEMPATLLYGVPAKFYAVQSTLLQGVEYRWEPECPLEVPVRERDEYLARVDQNLRLEPVEGGKTCQITVLKGEEYGYRVKITAGTRVAGEFRAFDIYPEILNLDGVADVSAVTVQTPSAGLGETVYAGHQYENGGLKPVTHPIALHAFGTGEIPFDSFEYTVSDARIATVALAEAGPVLVPKGEGAVTVEIAWKGNASFGRQVRTAMRYYVSEEAVEVSTSEALYRMAGEGRKIVLTADLHLGADGNGDPLPEAQRQALLQSMKSTYNTHFYRQSGKSAEVKYAIEFKNDVYGNGHTLSAEYLSNAKDGAGVPLFFRGPLVFVSMGSGSDALASVAAQDNISFLVRTEGVTLYNLELLGCDDVSLEENGQAELTKLDSVGTTLEVCASAQILNCRVRNGRNVVRAYGGNLDGEHYFIESLSENSGTAERITVTIDGCILSNGREFLLKMGTNRTLRSGDATGVEPDLLDASGNPYLPKENNLSDQYFVENYLLCDVTLKDSVLEKCGFFTVGVESNFSGPFLFDGAEQDVRFEGWSGAGGTSFASVLRLKGDVRLYDWKELDQIDSSTLISTKMDELKLDVAAMLRYVCENRAGYGNIIERVNGVDYVHGGIAFYGGGKNYSVLDTSDMVPTRNVWKQYDVNISVLSDAGGSVGHLGQILPAAAGTQDFRFFLAGADGAGNYQAQLEEAEQGVKYAGIGRISPF